MKKRFNNKGFTMAELLIVVAIIAVLVAVAVPVFGSQLEKAREAADESNIRALYAELSSAVLTEDTTFDTNKVNIVGAAAKVEKSDALVTGTATYKLTQLTAGFQGSHETEGTGGSATDYINVAGVKVEEAAFEKKYIKITIKSDGTTPTIVGADDATL